MIIIKLDGYWIYDKKKVAQILSNYLAVHVVFYFLPQNNR